MERVKQKIIFRNNSDKLQNLFEEREILLRDISDLKSNITSLEQKFEITNGELTKKSKMISSNETEKFIRSQQISALTTTLEDERKQFQIQIDDLQAENLHLRTKLEQLNNDIENMDDISMEGSFNIGQLLDGVEKEDSNNESYYDTTETKYNKIPLAHSQGRRKSKSKSEILNDLNSFLSKNPRDNTYDSMNCLPDVVITENDDESDNQSFEQLETNNLKHELEKLKKENDLLHNELKELRKIVVENKNFDEKAEEIQEKDSEIERLTKQLEEKSFGYSKLMSEIQMELEKCRLEKRKVSKELKALKARINKKGRKPEDSGSNSFKKAFMKLF